MKKYLALLLALVTLLLCGCAGNDPEPTVTTGGNDVTSAPSTEPSSQETTESPTTTSPVLYRNPLNGVPMEAPYTGRVFTYSISNTSDALPHVGALYADIIMETFVNNTVVRCLGLYTNIQSIDALGSTRSTRLMFNDITEHYDAILCHAGGSDQVLNDLSARGIDHFNVEYNEAIAMGASYRDKLYGRGQVHSLFGVGTGLVAYAESRGFRMTQPEDKDYGLRFTEDGTPAGGEDATEITVTITYNGSHKDTTMVYDPERGEYLYYQYGALMCDQITEAPETFENVVVMFADIWMNGNYQETEFRNGGTGYYACGGKIIPITWSCDGDDQPFRFFTQAGEPVEFGVGRSYIAITQNGSKVVW